MGARGNSGVILSQIVRGVADVLGRVDERDRPDARRPGVARRVGRGVPRRAAAGRGDDALGHPRARGGGRAASGRAGRRSATCSSSSCAAGRRRSPARREQLDVLREAGVVDAGGAGLVELLRGFAGAVTGEAVPVAPRRRGAVGRRRDPPRALALPLLHRLRRRGGRARPRRARGAARAARRLARRRRRRDRAQGARPHRRSGRRALARHRRGHDRGSRDREHARAAGAAGAAPLARPVHGREERSRRGRGRRGNRRLFETLAEPSGRSASSTGGQTANPSTAELVAALEELEADEAIVLPNNPNVRLAAEHAAEHGELPAWSCRRSRFPPGSPRSSPTTARAAPPRTPQRWREAAAAVATGEVTRASRDVELNGVAIRSGDWLGLADGEPVAGGDDFVEVAFAVVERLLAEPRGAPDAPDRRRAAAARRRSSSGSRPPIRSSRSRCTKAASRTTRFCSARNRVRRMPPVRIVLVEDNEVFREALELLLGMRDDVEVVASVGDGGGRRLGRAGAPARRRADGLPAARARRRPGDGRRSSRGVPGVASSP